MSSNLKELPSAEEADKIRNSLVEDAEDVIEAQAIVEGDNTLDTVDGGQAGPTCAKYVSELSTNSVNHRTLKSQSKISPK